MNFDGDGEQGTRCERREKHEDDMLIESVVREGKTSPGGYGMEGDMVLSHLTHLGSRAKWGGRTRACLFEVF